MTVDAAEEGKHFDVIVNGRAKVITTREVTFEQLLWPGMTAPGTAVVGACPASP